MRFWHRRWQPIYLAFGLLYKYLQNAEWEARVREAVVENCPAHGLQNTGHGRAQQNYI